MNESRSQVKKKFHPREPIGILLSLILIAASSTPLLKTLARVLLAKPELGKTEGAALTDAWTSVSR
jgi:hypothetical protein